MPPISPEFYQFSYTDPVVYSEFDSDLEGESLSFAKRRFEERWENESVLNLGNIFEGKSVLTNMVDILSPVVHDEIQKLNSGLEFSESERAEKWAALHFPEDSLNAILLENAHPEGLLSNFTLEGSEKTFTQIARKLAEVGQTVSVEQVKQALLSRYVKDGVAIEKTEQRYGIGGKFASGVGNFLLGTIRDPLNFIEDLLTLGVAGGAVSTLGFKGIAGVAAVLGVESAALAGKHVAVLHSITNDRRASVGLDPLPLQEIFKDELLAGITLGAAFSGTFALGGAALRKLSTAFPNKSPARRAVEIIGDAQGRYKHSKASDSELMTEAQRAALKPQRVATSFTPESRFPRISDPSVPEINRSFNNAIGSIMKDTPFIDDTKGVFSQKLSDYTGQMSESDLFLLSEALSKAKNYEDFYPEFIKTLKFSENKDGFVKGLKGLLFDEETKKVKEYIKRTLQVDQPNAEMSRNSVGYEALHRHFEGVISAAEAEGSSLGKFLRESPTLSKENPHMGAETETDIRLAADFERIRAETFDLLGSRETFKPSDFLLGKIEELNGYSANLNGLRGEFSNAFTSEMKDISVQELLDAWGEGGTPRSNKIKNILSTLKARRRAIAEDYGIEYGEIADHVPQKWAQEKIAAVKTSEFIDDFLPMLDKEKSREAYHANTREKIFSTEKRLIAQTNKLKESNEKKARLNKKFLSTLEEGLVQAEEGRSRLKTLRESQTQVKNNLKKLESGFLRELEALEESQETEIKAFLDKENKELRKAGKARSKELRGLLYVTGKASRASARASRSIVRTSFALSEAVSKGDLSGVKSILTSKKNELESLRDSLASTLASMKLEMSRAEQAFESAKIPKKNDRFLSLGYFQDQIVKRREQLTNGTDFLTGLQSDIREEQGTGLTVEKEKLVKLLTIRQASLSKSLAKLEAKELKNLPKSTMERRLRAKQRRIDNLQQDIDTRIKGQIEVEGTISTVEAGRSKIDDAKEISGILSEEKRYLASSLENEKIYGRSLRDSELSLEVELEDLKSDLDVPRETLTSKSLEKVREDLAASDARLKLLDSEEKTNAKFLERLAKEDVSRETLDEASSYIAKTRAKIRRLEAKGLPEDNAGIRFLRERLATLNSKVNTRFGAEELTQIRDNILSDDLRNPSAHSADPSISGGKRRILHFKDMASFDSLNRKYGAMPDFRMLVTRDFDSQMRDISRLRAFGGSMEFFKRQAESDLKTVIGNRPLGFAERQLKSILDANVDYVSGLKGRPSTMISALGKVYLSLIRMAALGGAGLTTLVDDANSIAFAGAQNGFGFFRTLGQYIQGISSSGVSREEASRLLVSLDAAVNSFDEELYRFPSQRSIQDVEGFAEKISAATFKISGVNYLTDSGRIVFNKLFLQELGALRSEGNNSFKGILESYGLGQKQFSELNTLPLDEDGIPIFNEAFKRSETFSKMLRALYGESRKAIASTSQSLKAVMASEGYGGQLLGIMNSLFFLKRIPMQVFFDKTLVPIFRGRYGEAAKFFSQNLIFTTARLTLKYLTFGYAPNFSDPNFYREVLLQSSSNLPFLQPLFSMDRLDRFSVENALGRAFLGAYAPIVDIGQLVVRDVFTDVDAHQVSKDAHRVIKDFAPLKYLPPLRLIYERYLFDNFLLATDPEAFRTIARAERARTESGKIKVF